MAFVVTCVVVVVVGVGGAAHHAEHVPPAGVEEAHQEGGGQDEEGGVEPGGVVPADAFHGDLGIVLVGDESEAAEGELHEQGLLPGRGSAPAAGSQRPGGRGPECQDWAAYRGAVSARGSAVSDKVREPLNRHMMITEAWRSITESRLNDSPGGAPAAGRHGPSDGEPARVDPAQESVG